MYTRHNKIFSDLEDIVNYIDGSDVYNSKLIELLRDPGLPRKEYEIKTFEYRPDLIAKEYYGSDSYTGLIMIQNGFGLENYTKGTVLELIYKTDLDNVIRNIW